jgi:hypothetical protein
MTSTSPFPSKYLFIDRLPQVVCLELSQRHTAYKGCPLTTKLLREGTDGLTVTIHVLENTRRRTGDMRKFWHASRSASRTPYEAMGFLSFPTPRRRKDDYARRRAAASGAAAISDEGERGSRRDRRRPMRGGFSPAIFPSSGTT